MNQYLRHEFDTIDQLFYNMEQPQQQYPATDNNAGRATGSEADNGHIVNDHDKVEPPNPQVIANQILQPELPTARLAEVHAALAAVTRCSLVPAEPAMRDGIVVPEVRNTTAKSNLHPIHGEYLRTRFAENPNPNSDQIEAQEKHTGLSYKEIHRWYENHRSLLRKNSDTGADAVAHRIDGEPHTLSLENSNALASPLSATTSHTLQSFTFSQTDQLSIHQASSPTSIASAPTHKVPYACTAPNHPNECRHLTFANEASWKRHENNVHWPQMFYRCVLCSIRQGENGNFYCRLCNDLRTHENLQAIATHVLCHCTPEKKGRTYKDIKDFRKHSKDDHPHDFDSLSQKCTIDNQDVFRCVTCREYFPDKDCDFHICDGRGRWHIEKTWKDEFTESSGRRFEGRTGVYENWLFHVNVRDSGWAKKCTHCDQNFDSFSFDERAKHYSSAHFKPSKAIASDVDSQYGGSSQSRNSNRPARYKTRAREGGSGSGQRAAIIHEQVTAAPKEALVIGVIAQFEGQGSRDDLSNDPVFGR